LQSQQFCKKFYRISWKPKVLWSIPWAR
jgi:hypothetical protein